MTDEAPHWHFGGLPSSLTSGIAYVKMQEILTRQTQPGGGDIEDDHAQADAILCARLNQLGETELVDLFLRLKKWYA